MEKKNMDWSTLGFGYHQTEKRYVTNYKNGAWDEGVITEDANIVLNECAGVFQSRCGSLPYGRRWEEPPHWRQGTCHRAGPGSPDPAHRAGPQR